MALAIGTRLHPVPAQGGHAPPPRRRLRPVEAAALLGRAHLEAIQGSLDGTKVEFGCYRRQPGQGIASCRTKRHAIVRRFHDKRKCPQGIVQWSNGILVVAPLDRIACGRDGENRAAAKDLAETATSARRSFRKRTPR